MAIAMPTPVIDIFAGPGGLSEGFSQCYNDGEEPVFDIRLSIEKDAASHQTLELRSFFRQFPKGKVPKEYYDYISGKFGRDAAGRAKLFADFPVQAALAKREAWKATLGKVRRAELTARINNALNGRGNKHWVLIGGPPCQAYSLVGRSRMKRVKGKKFLTDHRHVLYRQYLRILAKHRPTIFIMENVKGLLSSKHEDRLIVEKIISDLQKPGRGATYRLFSLIEAHPKTAKARKLGGKLLQAKDFVVAAERFGIPQARHRVIFLGVAEKFLGGRKKASIPALKQASIRASVNDVIGDLPRLRSGVSKRQDSADQWITTLQTVLKTQWFKRLRKGQNARVAKKIQEVLLALRAPRADRGNMFVNSKCRMPRHYSHWYCDDRMVGVCNHESRRHIEKDLHRYLFAACYAAVHRVSPKLQDFPEPLLPAHKNVNKALGIGLFNDRFRVQRRSQPATTVTSHIAKDGHYFIHPDPSQCRSLTVREAARLQTFPDNYYFEGTRTDQYRQVGNAVPPLLAHQIAEIVYKILSHK